MKEGMTGKFVPSVLGGSEDERVVAEVYGRVNEWSGGPSQDTRGTGFLDRCVVDVRHPDYGARQYNPRPEDRLEGTPSPTCGDVKSCSRVRGRS